MTSNARVSATRNAPCRRRPVLAGLGCLVLCAPLLASACKSDGALGPDGTGGFVPIWSSPPTVARDNGAIRWKVNVGVGYTFPAHVHGVGVSGDTVYAALERYLNINGAVVSGVLVALDRRDGHELWRYETPGTHDFLRGAPVPIGRVVLVSDFYSGDVVAVDVVTHTEAWRTPAGGPDGTYVVGQTVFVAGVDHQARALDLATGSVKGAADTEGSDLGYGSF